MVLPTDPGISYSTTKAVSAPIVAVVTPPTMAATPPKRMSIEDAIADSPFVLVLTWNSAIQKESAHLSLGLIHRSAWRGCMKSGPRVLIRYSSTHEKTLPNGSLRCRMELHRTPHASPQGAWTPQDPQPS